jgi:hypothetical protein
MSSLVSEGSTDAMVTFRVRAETIGFGETIYLYPENNGKVPPIC